MIKGIRPEGEESGTFDRLVVRPSRWRGVRAKVVGSYLLVSAATVAFTLTIEVFGVPGTGFRGSMEVRTEEARRSLDRQADTTAAQIQLWFEDKKHQFAVLARNDLVGHRVERLLVEFRNEIDPDLDAAEYWRERALGGDYSDLVSLLRRMAEGPEGAKSVWVVDAKSKRIVLATDRAHLGVDVSGTPFIRNVLSRANLSSTGVGGYTTHEGFKNIAIAFAIGGSRRSGYEAVLVVHFDPDRALTPLLTAVRSMASSVEAFVVDGDGMLLTSLEHSMTDGVHPQPLLFLMEDEASTLATEGGEGRVSCVDYRGREVLAAVRSVAINRDQWLGLVVKRDLDDVLEPLHAGVRHAVLASLVAMGVLCLVVVVIARSFISPVLVVARAAYSIARGDFDARAPVTTSDEVGALAAVFNAMADRIQETHQELEARVQERTARLEDAKAALEAEVRERRSTEVSLRESEARYRAVAEDAPLMLCRFTPKGEITFANDSFRDFFVSGGDSIVGMKIQDCIPAEVVEAVMTNIGSMTPSSPTMVHEYPVRTANDSTRLVKWTNRAVFDDGGVCRSIVSVGEEVTEWRQAEEKLQDLSLHLEDRVERRTAELRGRVTEVEDLNRAVLNLADDIGKTNRDLESAVRGMEEANRELESFAYSVSHDLRAPLRHIAGFVGLLQQSLADRLEEDDLRYLTLVAQSADRMSLLIDDLLAFSRTGTRDLQPVDVDLGKLVREVSGEVEERAGDREITWRINRLPVVRADRATLRLALVNLLENAVKYTRTREQALIEIGAERNDDDMEIIWVRDNGVGFDPEYADKLFGVFHRLHRQEDFEGTGIGLANVRRIINRHGGETWAEGEVDRGATFFFSLPERQGQNRTDG